MVQYDQTLKFRLSKQQKEEIKKNAEKQGFSASKYIRNIILNNIQK